MTEQEARVRILEDLDARGAILAGVIAIVDGQLKIITYDHKGSVDAITQGDNAIQLYGKASVNTGAMRELFTLSVPGDRKEEEEKE